MIKMKGDGDDDDDDDGDDDDDDDDENIMRRFYLALKPKGILAVWLWMSAWSYVHLIGSQWHLHMIILQFTTIWL